MAPFRPRLCPIKERAPIPKIICSHGCNASWRWGASSRPPSCRVAMFGNERLGKKELRCRDQQMSIDEETVRERQARVARAGGRWEEYVRLFLIENLQNTGIDVIYGKNESAVRNRSSTLWKMLSLPLKSSTLQEYVWGDIDLLAVRGEIPISVISCKVSLHGRFTETLFWSLLFRTLTRVKVVLATPDGGRGTEGEWKSEWGTPDEPTKDRLLAESYLEGVYVQNVDAFCRDIKPAEGTNLGGIVRPLNELPQDLTLWAQESSRHVYVK